MRVVLESTVEADGKVFEQTTEFIRVTDDDRVFSTNSIRGSQTRRPVNRRNYEKSLVWKKLMRSTHGAGNCRRRSSEHTPRVFHLSRMKSNKRPRRREHGGGGMECGVEYAALLVRLTSLVNDLKRSA